MRRQAVLGAVAIVLAGWLVPGPSAAQVLAEPLALRPGFGASGVPEILTSMSPAAAGLGQALSLAPLGLFPALGSALPAAPAVVPFVALRPGAPLSPQAPAIALAAGARPGALLAPDHAAIFFAAVPDLSRFGSVAAKQTAEADFVGRLGSALAEPSEAAAAVDPELQKAEVLSLRATQMAAGMREVEHKTAKLHALEKDPHELKHYLKANPVPVVVGPKGRLYIIDHHHLVRAAWEAGVPEVYIEVKADLSGLSESAFWDRMKQEAWVYPYDEAGRPRGVTDLPQDVRGLADDPYRSVAWAVRERGGYEKTGKPFAEFKWADFFRARLKTDPRHHDFEKAVDEAVALAKSPEAKGLPGYVGRP